MYGTRSFEEHLGCAFGERKKERKGNENSMSTTAACFSLASKRQTRLQQEARRNTQSDT